MVTNKLTHRAKLRTLVLEGPDGVIRAKAPVLKTGGTNRPGITDRDGPRDLVERVPFLLDEGIRSWESGDFSMAEDFFRKSLVAVRSAGLSKSWQALSATYLAELYDETYRISEARQLYRSAVTWLDEATQLSLSEIELRYKCQNNLACLLKANEEYAASEGYFVQAINVLEADLPDAWEHRSVLYQNLGALYHSASYFDAALEMHRRALEYARKIQPEPMVYRIKLHRNLALAAIFAKQPELALQHLEQAHQLAEHCPEFPSESLVELLITEASTRYRQNDLAGAENFCIRAISLAQQGPTRGNSLLPVLYSNLGCVYAKAGLPEQSREMFEDAHLLRLANLNTTDEELRASHYNLALLSEQLKDTESSARHRRQMEHISQRMQQQGRTPNAQAAVPFSEQLIYHEPTALPPAIASPLGLAPIGLQLSEGR
jgi:tetratricopeptide (TPR) repeat protein